MRKIIFIITIFIALPFYADAASLGQELAGKILLNVEGHGEAWYVYPKDNKRYYLGRPADAFSIMRELGLGITEIDFQKIAQAGMPVDGDLELARRLSGKIILQVEKNGEAWYIYPKDLKKYYLGRPADAFRIMRELSLGITTEDLAKIHKPGLEESINQYSSYKHSTISTTNGNFTIDVVTIDLANPNLEIITDTAEPHPSPLLSFDYAQDRRKERAQYGATSLAEFVIDNNGFAGINGSYFCSESSCGEINYYFYPVYNSRLNKMINEDQLKYWTTGPIFVFDQDNNFYYFKDSREFEGITEFSAQGGPDLVWENKERVKIQSAIGNKPRLIENSMNALIEWEIDDKQKNIKSLRNAIAYKDKVIYLVTAHNSTVPDLADIMKAMEVEYALNLDGGYSASLWYNDEYMVGPGRDIPNAIIFKEK